MPSLFACLVCGGRGESDDIRMLDYCHASLTDVPSDVFACERTLEELYLDSNQLSELPRQLFYCHGLRVLGLSDNELSSLPPAVASLINLTSLDLSKNAISDIPDNIKGCKQLSVVDASINPLCRLPEGFTQLLSLQELYLNDTFLEYLPANFGRLSRLRILELRENQLNTLPKSIARLTSLQRLDIGQNDFSELPEVIGSLGSLTELWFDNNKVKSLPPLLGRLKKLVHVDASKNKVDWVAGELENCVMLTDLHLSSNDLKRLPEKLGGCRQLQVLKLDDNALTHLPETIGELSALEELVVTQNDLETLPASMGLLRALHTLHVDDNLLTELPPELGSCSRLTVLTAASNHLTSVPAELGHLPRLAVLNLCDNLIPHLPVSLTKLKLRALWLSENQNKPQVQLQSETLPETGQRVLTCFMLPQQPRVQQPENVVEADTFPGQSWEEQRRAKTLIKFAFDGDVDKPGRLMRAPTPYPKELKALAKHARNLHSLQKDSARQFVLGRSQDSSKTSSSNIIASTKDETDTDSSRKVVAMTQSREKAVTDPNKSLASSVEDCKSQRTTPSAAESSMLSCPEATNSATLPVTVEGELTGDSFDKRIKKPPPYHIAAVMSRHAADFNESSVDASLCPGGLESSNGPVKEISESKQQSSAASHCVGAAIAAVAEDETNDTSSSSDSGYSNGKTSSQQIIDEQHCSDGSGINTPSSPQNLTDSGFSMPSISSPQSSTDVASPHSLNSLIMPVTTAASQTSSISIPSPVSGDVMLSVNNYSRAALQNTPPTTAPSLSVSHPSSDSPQKSISKTGDTHNMTHSGAMSGTRPASIATGTQLEKCSTPVVHRPGSLALGNLADTALLNRLPRDHRPGSLAAPINTLGIPPAPARAASHMGLNVTTPTRSHDLPMFKSQDFAHIRRGWTPDLQTQNGASNHRQESNGLVSIIDQVTSSLLEHGDSPPPKMSACEVTSSFDLTSSVAAPSSGYSLTSTQSDIQDASLKTTTTSVDTGLCLGRNSSSRGPHEYQDSNSSSGGRVDSSMASVGPANFTQDQPRGEVLHPTPHRPHFSSSARPARVSLQDPLSSAQDPHSVPYKIDGGESQYETSELSETESGEEHSETSILALKAASKPHSRIPSLSPEVLPGNKHIFKDSHVSSQTYSHQESRIPTLNIIGRSSTLTNDAHSSVESRIPIPASMGRSSGSLAQETRGSSESQIPSISSKVANLSNSYCDKQAQDESRIPALSSAGRNSSNVVFDNRSFSESRKPTILHSSNESQIISDSRIPVIGMMGRTSSNLTRESFGIGYTKLGNSDVTVGNKNFVSNKPLGSGSTGNNGSGIPLLSSKGRSNSNLGPVLPNAGNVLTTMIGDSNKHLSYSYVSQSQNHGDISHVSSTARLQSPGYTTGIRPPTIHSPSQQQPIQPSLSSYPSGIRPPTVNAAINTPGIPIPFPMSPSNHLANPGSRGSITSTGSASRIPMASGGAPSRLPAPSSSKHRISPAGSQSSDGNKSNQSAWMFGQHKNARVVCQNFPVVIEKNPDLGFTIGQSHTDPEDKVS
nr:mucin-5AC-like isoform X5 [Cherax quadricarinatus]